MITYTTNDVALLSGWTAQHLSRLVAVGVLTPEVVGKRNGPEWAWSERDLLAAEIVYEFYPPSLGYSGDVYRSPNAARSYLAAVVYDGPDRGVLVVTAVAVVVFVTVEDAVSYVLARGAAARILAYPVGSWTPTPAVSQSRSVP